jgi:hypothetical protein
MECAAVRKIGSLERCTAKSLKGHTLCGRHVRSKHVVLWSDANKSKAHKLVRIQAIVRGWLLRKRLELAGPGVLSRKNLANDEDLETCEESAKEHPLTYFAFEESGKIWWFSFPTIWKWCLRNPTNPYTKVPLSHEARKRLRQLWYYQKRHKIPLPASPPIFQDRLNGYWNIIRQTFDDYGFGDIHPNIVFNLHKHEYMIMFRMIRDDIPVTMQNKAAREKVDRYLRIALQSTAPVNNYILFSAYTLMVCLMVPKEPYELAFTVLSALYRC